VIGCKVEANIGENIRIYDERCKVVGKLAPTGTGLDTAVYCGMDTMKILLKAAETKGVSHKVTSDPDDDVISAIYVKVKDGYDISEVNSKIQGHTRKCSAVRTKSMLTDVSDSLAGISKTVTVLIAAIWALALVILLIAFAMIAGERKREFAVLRLLGSSRAMLIGLVLKESALCSLAGGVLGVLLASLIVFPFTTLIETKLGLPYLRPEISSVTLLGLTSLAATVMIGAAASAWTSFRLSRVDPGTVLREGN
jgi:putative ABC transport system permease protein